MLVKPITYEDFDGNEITENFYFNLNESEMIELEASYPNGLVETMEKFLEANDRSNVIQTFKKLIKLSYGIRPVDDTKRFVKSEELSLAFTQTNAYNVLFMELATDDKAGGEFMIGILPNKFENDIRLKLAEESAKAAHEEKKAAAAIEAAAEPAATEDPNLDTSATNPYYTDPEVVNPPSP